MNIEKVREEAARAFNESRPVDDFIPMEEAFIEGAKWEHERSKWVNVEDGLPNQDTAFTKFNRSIPVLVQDEAGTVTTATISLDSQRWYIDAVPLGKIIRWTEIPKL